MKLSPRPNHELFPCRGGAWTLREPASGQAMHSEIGPLQEARSIFIEPARLAERAKSGTAPLAILDQGMGIAANAVAALAEWSRVSNARRLHLISFESDPSGLGFALSNLGRFEFLAPWAGAARALLREGRWESRHVLWELRSGPFERASLEGIAADLVFHDFYAPKTCPELWGRRTFERIRGAMARDGLLLTYSAATSVRSAMILAGLRVGRGPGTAMKGESTQAALDRAVLRAPLGTDWIAHLSRSGRPLPDDHGCGSRDEALERVTGSLADGTLS